MPVRTPGIYGFGEKIVILMRFNRPVVVIGFPYLELKTGVTKTGKAKNIKDFYSFELLFDILDTDIIFEYTVEEEDNIDSLSHSSNSSIHLNGSQILRKSTFPDQPVDISLKPPGDFNPVDGIVDRQWMYRFPQKIEILFRDFYHSNPHSLTVSAEHSGRTARIFSNSESLRGKTLGHPFPKSKSKNNRTIQNTDSAIGYNYFFSETLQTNIGTR